jgi:azurin
MLAESEWTAVFDPEHHGHGEVASTVDELVREEEEAVAAADVSVALAAKRVTEMPESWNGRADQTIRLGTNPGLRFDLETIEVQAGSRIALVFDNDDDMQHNVVIVQPGTADKVGEQAMQLGLRGGEMHYVPDNDNVLYYTSVLGPGASETIYFTAPEFPGNYTYVCTFPGHHIIMRGTLVVQ